MKALVLATTICGFVLKQCINYILLPTEHLCDFALNPHSSIKPVVNESTEQNENVWCTADNLNNLDYVAMICPNKKEGDYTNLEVVPANCFSKHLYSPYDSEEKEKDMELLDFDTLLSINKSYKDFALKILLIPRYYKQNKTIYCRCDNSKTKKEHGSEKLEGKSGIVKIVLNKKNKNPRGFSFLESSELEPLDIVQNGNDKIVQVKENETVHFEIRDTQKVKFEDDETYNIRYGVLTEKKFFFRFPTVFFNTSQFVLNIEESAKPTIKIIMKYNKTESIDGCDFTKPKGEGIYKNGFVLNEHASDNNICSVHIGSRKKSLAAGIKCPYKLTPTYCFRHVLYEKNTKNQKSFHPYLLMDILETVDVEFYSNVQEGSYVVGLPTSPRNFTVVRCVCENNGKTGIMELQIDSPARSSFLSLALMLFAVALLYIC
ncbi:6-cysteine protein [Plasmodium gonderi]|uniref:6-cysteine protein n=1 Tax=Plasmodium gonderi TaxID=77519 RepID=A0A1Y1JLK5_PLAGO|nr:6-cysteine protein [Plasmodium gonderi]GAW82107.1 6-cysteine protein [Plasmodium gonderi]